jgi:hypothetical protein
VGNGLRPHRQQLRHRVVGRESFDLPDFIQEAVCCIPQGDSPVAGWSR